MLNVNRGKLGKDRLGAVDAKNRNYQAWLHEAVCRILLKMCVSNRIRRYDKTFRTQLHHRSLHALASPTEQQHQFRTVQSVNLADYILETIPLERLVTGTSTSLSTSRIVLQ